MKTELQNLLPTLQQHVPQIVSIVKDAIELNDPETIRHVATVVTDALLVTAQNLTELAEQNLYASLAPC